MAKDRDAQLALLDVPAANLVRFKTTDPIESTYATVRLRTEVTEGPDQLPQVGPSYKLIEQA